MDTKLNRNLEKLEGIKDILSMFHDPLDMIAQLIDIGKLNHNLNDNEKNDDNIILGCTSRAWIAISETSENYCEIRTDSDSHIVSALLYLLSLSVNNQSKNNIETMDGIKLLNSMGLHSHITSQRTNGFLSAIETLKNRIK